MDCASVYCDTDDGPSAFIAHDPKARKNHKCCECGRLINPGEIYRRESGIWDGTPRRHKTCLDCISIRNVFFDNGGFVFTEIFYMLDNHINDLDGAVPSECLIDLTDRARLRVFKMMDAYIFTNDMEG